MLFPFHKKYMEKYGNTSNNNSLNIGSVLKIGNSQYQNLNSCPTLIQEFYKLIGF